MLQRHLVESKELEKHHSDNLVFLAVEQLDRGLALIKQEDQVSIAELNLNAAHRAMSKSAFQAATDYVQIAADLLNSHWETNYELTMRVHTTAAQFHSCTGRFEECARTADAALGNAKRTMDKLPIYYTMIDALASQDLLSDALDLGVEVLNKELCVKTPRRASSLQVLRELNLVWRMIGKKTDDDLLTLPTISHEVLAAAIRVTMEISMIAFFAQENKNYPFLWLRAMKLTLMYGQDRVTPSIFACYGILNSFAGRYLAAHRFGMLARKLIEKTQAWADEGAVTEVLVSSFTSHWQFLIANQLDHYDKAYRIALAKGDTNFAVLADLSTVETRFACGANLVKLEQDCARSCNLLIALNKKSLIKACLPIWQCVLNLRGFVDDPLVLTGDAMDEEEMFAEDCKTGFDLAMSNAHQLKMTLACLFQDWEACVQAPRVMKKHPEIYLCISAHYFALPFTLFSGVSYSNLARATWRRRHLRGSRICLKRAAKWVKIGCPDAVPIHAMLVAEKAVFNRDLKNIPKLYDRAIAEAEKASLLHYKAFANERCGTVLWELSRNDSAKGYLQKALACYDEWGAAAKVEQIKFRFDIDLVKNGEREGESSACSPEEPTDRVSSEKMPPSMLTAKASPSLSTDQLIVPLFPLSQEQPLSS